MKEYKLYNIHIQPKSKAEAEDEQQAFDFKFVAETAVEALTKMLAIPDIVYMYDPCNDDIIISYEGIVY